MNDYREMYELYHHGVKGMKWGVRRYQNQNGSRTQQGRQHYKENSDQKRDEYVDKQIRKDNIKRGAKIAAGALLVVGGTAIASYYFGNKAGIAKGLVTGRKQGYDLGYKAATKAITKLTKGAQKKAYEKGYSEGGAKMKQMAYEHYKKKFQEYALSHR